MSASNKGRYLECLPKSVCHCYSVMAFIESEYYAQYGTKNLNALIDRALATSLVSIWHSWDWKCCYCAIADYNDDAVFWSRFALQLTFNLITKVMLLCCPSSSSSSSSNSRRVGLARSSSAQFSRAVFWSRSRVCAHAFCWFYAIIILWRRLSLIYDGGPLRTDWMVQCIRKWVIERLIENILNMHCRLALHCIDWPDCVSGGESGRNLVRNPNTHWCECHWWFRIDSDYNGHARAYVNWAAACVYEYLCSIH